MIPIHFFDDDWQPDPAGRNFRGACPAELGAGSQVVERAWVRWTAKWGGCTWKIVAWDATKPVGEADTRKDYWELPSGVRSFTVEGRREHAGVIPSATLLQRAK